ncbi:hypothetical protein V502_09706 [Pseudogymnoascus sp. VKM F-4520 (FW-2644)]|nr:hypothetical protein V502_09706 [Pseudogymnoascus sp. VKM F-4520 (FW-2644)]
MENNSKEKEPQIGGSSTATYDLEEYQRLRQEQKDKGLEQCLQELKDKGMWPEKPGDILEKIGKIKWSPTMSDDDSKRNVEDFNRLFSEFITWAAENAIENKDNPEAMKFHGFLCAQLTELGKSLEAKAS